MAQFKITSKLEGLSPSEAADYSRRYPYDDKGPRIDGDGFDPETFDLSRRLLITPDDKVWSVGSALTAFDDPRTGNIVKSWEKRWAKQVRKDREGWKGDIRLKADGSDGPEYDRYLLTLSKDDAARLGEAGIHKTFMEFVQALRESPFGSGNRMVEVEPIHQTSEDGHVHLHVMVHRHAFDVGERMVRRTVFQPEIHEKEAARIAAAISADITMEYIKGMGRGISEEAREEAVEAIREAGGEPSPELAGTRDQAAEWKQPDAEQARIEQALREIERRMARREEEKRADASLYTDLQNGLAAVRERESLKADIAERERTIEAAFKELEGLQEEHGYALETIKERDRDLEGARAEIATLTDQVAEAVNLVAEKGEQIETLTAERNELSTELGITTAALDQEKAGRQADAKAAADREATLQAEKAELAATIEETRKALEQARTATQTVRDELQAERDTFLDRARAWAEEHVKGPLLAQVDALKAELAEARKEFAGQMAEAQRAFMAQLKELTAGFRQQAAPAPQARRQFPAWAAKSFDQMSKTEQAAAQKSLDAQIKAQRIREDMPLDEFVNGVHSQWQKAQEADQANAPKPDTPKA